MPAKLPPGEARRRKTARHKAWRHKNRARLRALRQTRYVADPANERARVREYFRRRRVDAAGRPPPSACECCGRRGRLVFDHDHALEIFRGWICAACNTGIGLLGDNVEGLRVAVAYLEVARE